MIGRGLFRFGRKAYQECFEDTGKSGKAVLADLRNFCRAREGQLDIEVVMGEERDMQLIHLGRVQVYRRITKMLSLTDEQIDAMERQLTEIGGN